MIWTNLKLLHTMLRYVHGMQDIEGHWLTKAPKT